MDSLSMLDAGFLEAEDSDRHISLAIGSVSVLEGPIPDDDTFVSGLAERVLAVPRFRQVLRIISWISKRRSGPTPRTSTSPITCIESRFRTQATTWHCSG
jgi:hypothetical protein